MDVQLHGTSRMEAPGILRDHPTTASLAVAAPVARAVPSRTQQGLEAGFLAYLNKPIRVRGFMDALNTALESVLADS